MKIRASIIAGVTAVTACLFQFGCSMVNTVEPAQPEAQRQMMNDKRTITDARLYGRVRPTGVNTAMLPSALLKIQVEVRNLTSSLQDFSYHIEWFDASGMIVNTPTSAWIDRQIQGGETLSLTGVAPTEGAKDFRIKFISK